MKKLLFYSSVFILLSGISIHSFAAVVKDTVPSNAEFTQQFLQKSKNQKTTAWVLLGGGTLLNLIATAVFPKDYRILGNSSSANSKASTAFILSIAGTGSMLASIPFFIASKKNKKRAMNFSVKTELVPRLQNSNFLYKTAPSLNLTIHL